MRVENPPHRRPQTGRSVLIGVAGFMFRENKERTSRFHARIRQRNFPAFVVFVTNGGCAAGVTLQAMLKRRGAETRRKRRMVDAKFTVLEKTLRVCIESPIAVVDRNVSPSPEGARKRGEHRHPACGLRRLAANTRITHCGCLLKARRRSAVFPAGRREPQAGCLCSPRLRASPAFRGF